MVVCVKERTGRSAPQWTTLVLTLILTFGLALAALAADFPALSGRVVDQANVIPADTRRALESKLADLEAKSGIQLVVATVKSLGGDAIEPYANQLFRHWQLGEKAKNNGVLLLVAPNERRVRIEVGYGLEGTLTDAISSVIIANAMAPRFKAGDFAGGITRGVDDIITVLTTDASEWQKRPPVRLDSAPQSEFVVWLVLAAFAGFLLLLVFSRTFRRILLASLLTRAGGGYGRGGYGGGFGGGFSGGGGGGNGFSGGGGSSGGGGASGGW